MFIPLFSATRCQHDDLVSLHFFLDFIEAKRHSIWPFASFIHVEMIRTTKVSANPERNVIPFYIFVSDWIVIHSGVLNWPRFISLLLSHFFVFFLLSCHPFDWHNRKRPPKNISVSHQNVLPKCTLYTNSAMFHTLFCVTFSLLKYTPTTGTPPLWYGITGRMHLTIWAFLFIYFFLSAVPS